METISPEKLADAVMEGLQEYASLTTEKLKEAVDYAAKEAKKELHEISPKDTGRYSKSWTVKKVSETSNTVDMAVHSPKHYRLTHLLEYGHVLRQGGRTRPRPHIEKAQEHAEEAVMKRVEQALKG